MNMLQQNPVDNALPNCEPHQELDVVFTKYASMYDVWPLSVRTARKKRSCRYEYGPFAVRV